MTLKSQALAFIARPLAFFALSAYLAGAAQAAVVHQVSGGKLTGASGVIVSGVSYDVTFVDGTCSALFSGCDGPGDFVFNSFASAIAASRALLDFVFIDVGSGMAFDTVPSLTNGCTDSDRCLAVTPYAADAGRALFGAARNNGFSSDSLFGSDLSTTFDMGTVETHVYAVWRATSVGATVPEPSSLALLGAAGVALGWSQRRRRLRANDRVQ